MESFTWTCVCGKTITCEGDDRLAAERAAAESGWKPLDPMDGSDHIMVCSYDCARERNKGKPFLCNNTIYVRSSDEFRLCRKPAEFSIARSPHVVCGDCLLKFLRATDADGNRLYSIEVQPAGAHPGRDRNSGHSEIRRDTRWVAKHDPKQVVTVQSVGPDVIEGGIRVKPDNLAGVAGVLVFTRERFIRNYEPLIEPEKPSGDDQ